VRSGRTRLIATVALAGLLVGLLATAALLAGLVGPAAATDAPTVFAAASLTGAFPEIDPEARYSFAGSDTLAQQIRRGAPADVFASAAPGFTRELYRDGLVEKPRALATNRLTVIVPRSNPAGIRTVSDLRRGGVKLVVAAAGVPAGAYTRATFRRLGMSDALDNVVSQESDVKGVVGKVVLGEADAGVVYATDARAAAPRLARIAIPAAAQPTARYEIAVVRSSSHPAAARAFVAAATGAAGRRALAAAGFQVPEAVPGG
jgi:molybdate transport system substrate-binding protein